MKKLLSSKFLFFLLILSVVACERSKTPYGGIRNYEGNPKYDAVFDANKPPAGK